MTAVPLPEYPRPILRRENWLNLNGWWKCAFSASPEPPMAEEYKTAILVPYAPETKASGVGRTLQPGEYLHYRRTFLCPAMAPKGRLLLHFGAVDDACIVSVNGMTVGRHRGGYWPFTLDITDALRPGENELTVTVQDPTGTGVQARGKQTLQPGGMFYPAQSGIWQTVWLEPVPETYITALKLVPHYRQRSVTLHLECSSAAAARVKICAAGDTVTEASLPANCVQDAVLGIPETAIRPWS